MSDASIVEKWLERWEEMQEQGSSISLDGFVANFCKGAPPTLVEDFKSKACDLASMDVRLAVPRTSEANLPPSMLDVAPGSEIVPGYRLEQFIARGACGAVWRATGPGGVHAALKIAPLGKQIGKAEKRSLEIIKAIRHPNLLCIFGTWEKDNRLVVAMELADRSLAERLDEAIAKGLKGIPRDELLEYMLEAAKGLDFLHQRRHVAPDGTLTSIEHRDIKPQNLLLIGGSVKVADFGLVRSMEYSIASHSGLMTKGYAPPEFFKGKTTTQSDQYSLAVTYCVLRTGQLPFDDRRPMFQEGNLRHDPDLSALGPAERPVVARALATAPADRWPNCRAFVDALRGAADNRASLQEPSRSADPSTPARHLAAASADTVEHPRARGKRMTTAMWLVLLGCALLGIQALIRGMVSPPRGQSSAAEAASVPTTFAAPTAGLGSVKPPPVQPQEKDLTNSIGMRLVKIPPGKFVMGSPQDERGREDTKGADETQHEVEIPEAFWMGVTEVTQEQYQRVMKTNPSRFKDVPGEDTTKFPVEMVNWHDAKKFCQELSGLPEEAKHGRKYDLPTEAQWEYACRGGAAGHSAFSTGKTLTSQMANFNGMHPYPHTAEKGPNLARPRAVGAYMANGFGLYDMHGNVLEWCRDFVGAYDLAATKNPTGPASGVFKVRRGGAWQMPAMNCRTAQRGDWRLPGDADGSTGFRVVLVP